MRYPFLNRTFTLVCFSAPPLLGSVVSFVWHGGALWCALAVLSRRRNLSEDRIMLALAGAMYLFVAANVTAWALNDPAAAHLSSYAFLATFLLFPFSYSIWSIARKEDIASAAIHGSMWAGYGALAFAAIQFHVLGTRAEGGAGNAIVFATVTSMAGLVALAGAMSLKRPIAPYLWGAFVASLIALAYAQSRTIWLSTGMCLCMILWIYRSHLSFRLTRGMWVAAAVAMLLIGLVVSLALMPRIGMLVDNWRSFVGESDYSSSLGLRVAMWEIAVSLIREKPFFGHGLHEVRSLIETSLAEGYGVSRHFSHFHNGFLTTMVQSGLFGTVSLVAIFVIAIGSGVRTLLRSHDETERFGAAILVIFTTTYLIGGSTNILVGHDIIDVMFMIFLIVGAFLSSGRSKAVEDGKT